MAYKDPSFQDRVGSAADPLHDQAFIRALIDTYAIAPVTDWATPAA